MNSSDRPDTSTEPAYFDAVIVGAGFSGLYMLHRLRGLGLRVRVYEAGDDVGGTWFWNRYPGARCDIESMDYSYSFSHELEQEWEWTEKFATQPEILRYLNHVADRFGMRKDIVFGTTVQQLTFDEQRQLWCLRTDTGEAVEARFCVMATGVLSKWKVPDIPGTGDFGGDTYSTGHWPHQGVDFSGQRVGVIGTGSSGVQVIPLIAEQARHLTVFQRTPAYVLPAHNRMLEPGELQNRKARYPENRSAAADSVYGVEWPAAVSSALEVDANERFDTYEKSYDAGSLVSVVLSYVDILTDPSANTTAADYLRAKIRSQVADPDTAESLCPDVAFAVKRPCLGTNYYPTFNRENVTLVDLRKSPLTQITPNGIQTRGKEYPLDVLVFATGFDAITGALEAIDIRGRDGRTLKEVWQHGARAYLGAAVDGFPNLFVVTGPGSPSVLSNMLVSIEQHVDWIANAIESVTDRSATCIEVTAEAVEEWTRHVADVGAMTLYPTVASWYTGANVPGKPRVLLPYCGGVGVFRQLCNAVASKDYQGFVITGGGQQPVNERSE